MALTLADISKAFNFVSHDQLYWVSLKCYGVGWAALQILNSYLTVRCLGVKGAKIQPLPVKYVSYPAPMSLCAMYDILLNLSIFVDYE